MDDHPKKARARGLAIAAKLAGVSAVAIAALGAAQSAAAASHATNVEPPREAGWLTTPKSGNCGCAPCWGPPAPPKKTSRTRASARRRRRR